MSRRDRRNPGQPLPAPEPFSLASFDGTRICYDLYDAPSDSLVVVVPGFWRDRRHRSMVHLAQLLLRLGHRVAVVDVRGHGESGGWYGFNRDEHRDLDCVLRDLGGRGAIRRPVALLGLSYGGAISISTAARHPELPIGSLLLVSPVADFALIAPRLNLFTFHRHLALGQALRRPRFRWNFRRAEKFRAVDDVASLHLPLCFVHAKDDWLIGHQHSELLFAAANEPKELHILDVPGNWHADRVFSAVPRVVEPIVEDFLRRTLLTLS